MGTEVERAKYAATAPWSGVLNKPALVTDISQLTGAGYANGQVPVYNAATGRFRPGNLPSSSPSSPSTTTGTVFQDFNSPGTATKALPVGEPYSPTENIFLRTTFNAREYGAAGDDAMDDAYNVQKMCDDAALYASAELFFPAGTYYLSIPPSLPAIPLRIRGAGRGVTTLHLTSGGLTVGSGASQVEICDLTLTAGTGAGQTAVTVESSFGLWNLDLDGFENGIVVNTTASGFLRSIRGQIVDGTGLSLTSDDAVGSDILFFNYGSTATKGIVLGGSRNKLSNVRLIAAVSDFDTGFEVSGNYHAISDSLVVGCVNEVLALTVGTGASEGCRVQGLQFADCGAVQALVFDEDVNYVADVQGLYGNVDTSYDARKELKLSFTFDPGPLSSMQSISQDFSWPAAQPGDQLALGAPYALDGVLVSASIRQTGILTLTLFNSSGFSVDLGSGTWTCRLFS